MSQELSPSIKSILLKKQHPCYAPYFTLNFDVTGQMTVCCYNRIFVLGVYPEVSVRQAWFGPKMQEIRQELQKLNFNKGCDLCLKQLQNNNYNQTHIKDYDEYMKYGIRPTPRVLEMEISNVCNYECIMCGGKWSSSIRKNREKLPKIKSPYDDNFINQLHSFIPHLITINFLGGEPFTNYLYYKMWEEVPKINPNVELVVTTNGSIFNSQIEKLLTNKNFKIICSLDSLNEQTYNFIRKNGNFLNVMDNLKQFQKYNSLNGITFCPIIQNWHEIPDMLEYCNKNNLSIYFNNVITPLGGRIKGIHVNGCQDHAVDWISNPKVTNTLETLIPEVSLYTLPLDERKKITKFLREACLKYPRFKSVVESFAISLEAV